MREIFHTLINDDLDAISLFSEVWSVGQLWHLCQLKWRVYRAIMGSTKLCDLSTWGASSYDVCTGINTMVVGNDNSPVCTRITILAIIIHGNLELVQFCERDSSCQIEVTCSCEEKESESVFGKNHSGWRLMMLLWSVETEIVRRGVAVPKSKFAWFQ